MIRLLQARARGLWVGAAAALTLLGAAGAANAQLTTYAVSSQIYQVTGAHSAADCTAVGGCADYAIGQQITGRFVTGPLPANQVLATTAVGSFSFSDGINTYSSSDPAVRIVHFKASTNSSGQVTDVDVQLIRWRDGAASGHTAGTPGDATATQRLNSLTLQSSTSTSVYNDDSCSTYVSGSADSCSNAGPDSYTSSASTTGAPYIVVLSPTPTLMPLALIALAILTGGLGVAMVRRRA